MNKPYDYKNNVKVIVTPNQDVVVSMNKEIFITLINDLYEARDNQEKDNRPATAQTTIDLIDSLNVEFKEEA